MGVNGQGDGAVVAWFDSPHAVYLMLDVAPGLRYMHVHTAMTFAEDTCYVVLGRAVIMDELRRTGTRARYVISDLECLVAGGEPAAVLRRQARFLAPPRNPPSDLLPEHMPTPLEFPFNQPTLFRSRNGNGRYVVHRFVACEDNKE